MRYGESYLHTMCLQGEQEDQQMHFIYISDGNCLPDWEDDGTGSMIDILAVGTGQDNSIGLVDKILEGHEVETLIFPLGEKKEPLIRHFQKKGVSRILTGDGCLKRGGWQLTYWTDSDCLSIYYEWSLEEHVVETDTSDGLLNQIRIKNQKKTVKP